MPERSDPMPSRPVSDIRLDADMRWRPSTQPAPADGLIRRRAALSGLAGAAAFSATIGLSTALHGPSVDEGMRADAAPRSLNLVAAQTGETFSDVFAEGGRYDNAKLARLNRLLRDYQSGEVKPIDPALFDLMARVQSYIDQPLRVLSGYRSWRTNRFMYLVGFDVAENSQHVAAKAVDFSVPGMAAAKLGEIAQRCGAGGIGIYRSGFVHIDTGPSRHWTGA